MESLVQRRKGSEGLSSNIGWAAYMAPRNKIRSNGGRNAVTDLSAKNKETFPCNGCYSKIEQASWEGLFIFYGCHKKSPQS